jgi:hypothetical protein
VVKAGGVVHGRAAHAVLRGGGGGVR